MVDHEQETYRRVSCEEFLSTLADRDPYFENTHSYGTLEHTRYVDNDFVEIGYTLSKDEHDEFYLVAVE